MSVRAVRNFAFAFLLGACVFAARTDVKAAGEFDFWQETWECDGDFYFPGWEFVLCQTNCDFEVDPDWHNYFDNLTEAACNDYCNGFTTWEYYCYGDWHWIAPWGEDQCETFCECRCEYS